MFYSVKVLDPKGNLKKIISSKKLSSRFWRKYEQGEINPADREDYGLEPEKGFGGRSPGSSGIAGRQRRE